MIREASVLLVKTEMSRVDEEELKIASFVTFIMTLKDNVI